MTEPFKHLILTRFHIDLYGPKTKARLCGTNMTPLRRVHQKVPMQLKHLTSFGADPEHLPTA